MYQNRLQDLLKRRLLGLLLQESDSVGLEWCPRSCFLLCSLVKTMLLGWGPHFRHPPNCLVTRSTSPFQVLKFLLFFSPDRSGLKGKRSLFTHMTENSMHRPGFRWPYSRAKTKSSRFSLSLPLYLFPFFLLLHLHFRQTNPNAPSSTLPSSPFRAKISPSSSSNEISLGLSLFGPDCPGLGSLH